MSLDLEQDWVDRKIRVYTDINALLDQGIPVETAKHLAGWNPTLAYGSFADMQSGLGLPTNGYRELVRLMVSRSADRTIPGPLEGSVLDVGKLYSVFIPAVPELGITQINFSLDTVFHHTEFSFPWDYDGTQFSGQANRVTFVAGIHSIDAQIADIYGTFGISASFEVE